MRSLVIIVFREIADILEVIITFVHNYKNILPA